MICISIHFYTRHSWAFRILVTIVALVLTIAAQGQQVDDGYDDMMAAMIAAKIHQDSIDMSSLVAVYDYECQTQDADGKAVTDKMKVCVQVGQHCTRSFPYRKFLKERERAENRTLEFMEGYDFAGPEEIPLLRAESYCFIPEVWTDYPEGMTTLRDHIVPTIYETREVRKPINWTLTNDTMTVGDYLCKMATCELHGRKWVVCYSEDIFTTAGPWKLSGLPGMILKAEADGGIHRFTLASIHRTTTPIYYETSAITMKTSEEELIKNRIKTFCNSLYLNNPRNYIADCSSADIVYDIKGMLVNGVYVNDKPHVFQPLELDE